MPAPLRSIYAVGNVQSGEDDWVISHYPNGFTGGSRPPPLIYCHGYGGNADLTVSDPYQRTLMTLLAEDFTVLCGDFGFDTWGNGTGVARVEAARSYLASAWSSTGDVTVVGTSMGACVALNYAETYPANVRAVVGILPALDLYDMANNRGFSTTIDTAYFPNGAFGPTGYVARSPVTFASTMDASIPICLLTSSTDDVTIPSTADAFVTARPQTTRTDIGTQGHSYPSIGDATPLARRFAQILA